MTGFSLHLLRHGAPVLPGRLMGHTDCAPTADGIAACAAQAADLGAAHIVTSDLHRARAAAEAIGTPVVDRRWRELDFGAWDGLAPDQIDPDALARFWADPDANPPPGGELWSALVARIAAAIDALAPAPTLVVTHGGAIRAALHVLCGFEQARLWAFDLPYGVLVSLRVWPGARPNAQIVGIYP